MKKRLFVIVAVLLLVAMLTVCLCACNSKYYEKKLKKAGYKVSTLSEDEAEEFGDDVKWAVFAQKGTDMVYVIKYEDKDDAKDTEKLAKSSGMETELKGKILIAGTKNGVKAAK